MPVQALVETQVWDVIGVVAGVLQGCFIGWRWLLQQCYRHITGVSLGYYRDITETFSLS